MVKRVLSIVKAELARTLAGTGQFYAGYLRMLVPSHGPLFTRIVSAVVYVIPLVFLFGHPWFPDWLKVAGALVMLWAVSMVAREFVRQARRASHETRPQVRGALLGLFPFFLASVAALVWGLVGVLPQSPDNPWMVNLNTSFPAAFPAGPDAYSAEPADALLEADGFAYWCYAIQTTLAVPVHWIFEKVAALFGGHLPVARLWAWNEPFMVLEFIIQLISAALFVGILVDIGLAVQAKISMGEDVGADLSENFGHTMLAATRELGGDSVPRLVQAEEGMRRIRTRAFAYLRQHLRDKRVSVRKRAAQALGEWADPRAAALLASVVLRDDDPGVRAAAAEALGLAADAGEAGTLVRALTTDEAPEVINACRSALRIWAPEAALDPLTDGLGALSPARRSDAAGAIADVIDSGDLHETRLPGLVTRLTGTKLDEERNGLLLALARLCDVMAAREVRSGTREAVRKPLQEAVDVAAKELGDADTDTDLETEITAAVFLGSAVSWLADDEGFRSRWKLRKQTISTLVDTLGSLRDDVKKRQKDKADDEMPDAGDMDPSRVRLRTALLTALGRLGGKESRKALVDHLRTEPETVALAAISALGRTDDPDSVGPLVDLLGEADGWSMREDAICRALGALALPGAREVLETRLTHAVAVHALGRLGDAEALPAMLTALDGEAATADPHLRSALLIAIGRTVQALRLSGDKATGELDPVVAARARLEKELARGPVTALPAAAEALARAQGKEASTRLRDALRKANERAVGVAEGLTGIDDAELLAELADVLPECNVQVQQVILGALSRLDPGAISDDLLHRVQDNLRRMGRGATHLLSVATAQFSDGFTSLRSGAAAPLRFLKSLRHHKDDVEADDADATPKKLAVAPPEGD